MLCHVCDVVALLPAHAGGLAEVRAQLLQPGLRDLRQLQAGALPEWDEARAERVVVRGELAYVATNLARLQQSVDGRRWAPGDGSQLGQGEFSSRVRDDLEQFENSLDRPYGIGAVSQGTLVGRGSSASA